MRLTRLIIKKKHGQLELSGDFAGATGKRVRLFLGEVPPAGNILDVLRAGLKRVDNLRKDTDIGGM
jgi:hypothetical protein